MASGLAAHAPAESPARRLLIIGNSVSMSPATGVEAYPQRIAAPRGAAWQLSTIIHSGKTIEAMEPEILDALRLGPSLVILQVGINECAPRPLAPSGRARLATLKPVWLRDTIIAAIHRWRPQIIRLRPLAQFTPLDRFAASVGRVVSAARIAGDRKSTRLNSSHRCISYAVFCLKK